MNMSLAVPRSDWIIWSWSLVEGGRSSSSSLGCSWTRSCYCLLLLLPVVEVSYAPIIINSSVRFDRFRFIIFFQFTLKEKYNRDLLYKMDIYFLPLFATYMYVPSPPPTLNPPPPSTISKCQSDRIDRKSWKRSCFILNTTCLIWNLVSTWSLKRKRNTIFLKIGFLKMWDCIMILHLYYDITFFI